jgi:NTP pyrophosphatase (non-canonical NTP hydrolase)
VGDGNASTRQTEHQDVGSTPEVFEQRHQLAAGILPIRKDGPIMDLDRFQTLMRDTYGERDRARGTAAAVAWLAEEVGELAQAVRKGTPEQQLVELADVLAWLASIAEQLGLSLDEATGRYADGCPRCGHVPCSCPL